MIKQAIEQPRTEIQAFHADSPAQPEPGKKAGKAQGEGEEFESQLAAAAQLSQAAQPQPQLLPQAIAPGVDAGEALTAQAALSLNAADKTNGRDSAVGLTALAGLNQPKGAKDQVFEGEGQPQASAAKPSSLSRPDPLSKQEGSRPRGEAEGVPASKLDLLPSGAPWMAQLPVAGQLARPDVGTGAQSRSIQQLQPQTASQPGQQAQPQTALQQGADQDVRPGVAASPDSALEAQLASLSGVVQGLNPQRVDGTGAAGTEGRVLASGAKGRIPAVSAQAGLSGTDFLSALGAAKAGVVGARPEAGGQFPGGNSEQGEGKGVGVGAKPSLKVINGGAKEGKTGFGDELVSQSLGNLAAAPASHAGAATAGASGLTAEVSGHVTRGANAEERLSSESLAGISGGIRNLSAQGTGGELRIRLKPENLGELHVRVMTNGNSVGLQIQASDEKARKILEESLVHLKDSMAAQNLSLGAVDLTVAHSQSTAFGEGRGGGQEQAQRQGMFSDMLGGQGANQSNQREGRGGAWTGENAGSFRTARPSALGAPGAAQAFGPATAAAAASGRLDVRA